MQLEEILIFLELGEFGLIISHGIHQMIHCGVMEQDTHTQLNALRAMNLKRPEAGLHIFAVLLFIISLILVLQIIVMLYKLRKSEKIQCKECQESGLINERLSKITSSDVKENRNVLRSNTSLFIIFQSFPYHLVNINIEKLYNAKVNRRSYFIATIHLSLPIYKILLLYRL